MSGAPELVIIGGGPAGMAAATAAATSGVATMLIEEQSAAGGKIHRTLPAGFTPRHASALLIIMIMAMAGAPEMERAPGKCPGLRFRHHPGRMSKLLLLLTVIRCGCPDGRSRARRTVAENTVIAEGGGRAADSRAVEVNGRIGERHRSIACETGGISGDKRILQADLGTEVSLDTGGGVAGKYRTASKRIGGDSAAKRGTETRRANSPSLAKIR